jgi:hypothetical protein
MKVGKSKYKITYSSSNGFRLYMFDSSSLVTGITSSAAIKIALTIVDQIQNYSVKDDGDECLTEAEYFIKENKPNIYDFS